MEQVKEVVLPMFEKVMIVFDEIIQNSTATELSSWSEKVVKHPEILKVAAELKEVHCFLAKYCLDNSDIKKKDMADVLCEWLLDKVGMKKDVDRWTYTGNLLRLMFGRGDLMVALTPTMNTLKSWYDEDNSLMDNILSIPLTGFENDPWRRFWYKCVNDPDIAKRINQVHNAAKEREKTYTRKSMSKSQ